MDLIAFTIKFARVREAVRPPGLVAEPTHALASFLEGREMKELQCVNSDQRHMFQPMREVLAGFAQTLAGVGFALEWAGEQLERLTPTSDAAHELFSLAEQAQKAHQQARCAMMNCPAGLVADLANGCELGWDPGRVGCDE